MIVTVKSILHVTQFGKVEIMENASTSRTPPGVQLSDKKLAKSFAGWFWNANKPHKIRLEVTLSYGSDVIHLFVVDQNSAISRNKAASSKAGLLSHLLKISLTLFALSENKTRLSCPKL